MAAAAAHRQLSVDFGVQLHSTDLPPWMPRGINQQPTTANDQLMCSEASCPQLDHALELLLQVGLSSPHSTGPVAAKLIYAWAAGSWSRQVRATANGTCHRLFPGDSLCAGRTRQATTASFLWLCGF